MYKKMWASYIGLYNSLDEFRDYLKNVTSEIASDLESCEWAYWSKTPDKKWVGMNVPVNESESLDHLEKYYLDMNYEIQFVHKFKWGGFWEAGRLVAHPNRKIITTKGSGIRGLLPHKKDIENIMDLLEKKKIVKKLKTTVRKPNYEVMFL